MGSSRFWPGAIAIFVAIGITFAAYGAPPLVSRALTGSAARDGTPDPIAGSPSDAAPPALVDYGQACLPPSCLVYDVAEARGFFAADGIVVYRRPWLNTGAAIVEALGGDSLFLAAVSIEDALPALDQGKAVVVGSYARVPPYTLVAQPGIADLAALKGKILTAGSLVNREAPWLKLMLGTAGLRVATDYDIVVAGSLDERIAALQSGSVAAALFPPPADAVLLDQGKRALATAAEALGQYEHVVLLANNRRAAEDPLAVVRFLRAVRQAALWLADPRNDNEAIEILSRSSGLPRPQARATFERYVRQGDVLSGDLAVSTTGLYRALQMLGGTGGAAQRATAERYVDKAYWLRAAGPASSNLSSTAYR